MTTLRSPLMRKDAKKKLKLRTAGGRINARRKAAGTSGTGLSYFRQQMFHEIGEAMLRKIEEAFKLKSPQDMLRHRLFRSVAIYKLGLERPTPKEKAVSDRLSAIEKAAVELHG